MNILITGGAGYIGSHCLKALKGHNLVVVDDLSRGYAEVVPASIPLYIETIAHIEAIRKILRKHAIEAVIHCAAYAYVHESIQDPLLYYNNNISAGLALLEAMKAEGVKKLVFSSSCSVYGVPSTLPITEAMPIQPISPYGFTKVAFESILKEAVRAYGLRAIALRYFNAAGADPDGKVGDRNLSSPHIIPRALEVALGKAPHLCIFGYEYPTPDGTCIRDYIHVSDLAKAHALALNKLESLNYGIYNLGSGQPHSIIELISEVERITAKAIPYSIEAAKAGDPPALYADYSLAQKELGWEPVYSDLTTILKTAWAWRLSLSKRKQ